MKNEDVQLLNNFLGQFKDPTDLTLETYTGTGNNRNDFTYWIEWILDSFGGIKGGSSYKFGVFKCNETPKERNGYKYDVQNQYAWVEKYGETYDEAFSKVKKNITNVVENAQKETIDYDEIENIKLGDAYKWKIAFLYSKNRLVPVYQKDALMTAAKRIGVYPEEQTEITIAKLQKVLMNYYDDHQEEFNNDICNYGVYVWKIGTSELSQSNQIIKYGAPGTGKTYTTKKEAEVFFEVWKLDAQNNSAKFEDNYEFVQFHPSYSYEDFIEGIKPVINESGNTELKLTNGIFKSFCKKAAKYELWLLRNKILNYGQKLSDIQIKDIPQEQLQQKDCPFAFPENADEDTPVTHFIPPYFFVIDEINRADLSRVFGELMYCLEYRGFEGRIKTQYSELEKEDTIFYKDENSQHYFFIPNNVYIIGTMNTIDRSVESFDFALRRRFLWQRIDPNENVLKEYFDNQNESKKSEFIIPGWNNLNRRIKQDLGPDYQIGHSYLMKLDKYQNFTPTSYRNIIWENHIKPILEEYYRGTGREAKERIDELEKQFKSKSENNG